jgi:hypothetical protein
MSRRVASLVMLSLAFGLIVMDKAFVVFLNHTEVSRVGGRAFAVVSTLTLLAAIVLTVKALDDD